MAEKRYRTPGEYPVGEDSFPKIRENGLLYVDKTAYVYNLSRYGYVFLSRPRRFGKSLLCSTLEAYFQGRRELFKGLAIEKLEAEWKEYPVLRFNISSIKDMRINEMQSGLEQQIREYEQIYGAKKGDEGYSDPNLTIMNTDKFDGFYSALAGRLESDFGYLSDKHRFHTGAGKKNIARRINGGVETNAFTIRASFKVTVWDDRCIAVAKTIAESIQGQLNSTSN